MNYIILGLWYISLRGVRCNLPPIVCLSISFQSSLRYFMCVQMLAGGPVYISVPDRAVCTGMAKGLGQSEDVVLS